MVKDTIMNKQQKWIDNFINKSELLSNTLPPVSPEELHQKLFKKLSNKINLLIDNKSVASQNFEELQETVVIRDTVFFYPQYFSGPPVDGKYKRDYNRLSKINCLVIDYDDVDAAALSSILSFLQSSKIKPQYIVNSGGGIHLYIIFDDAFDVFHASSLMSSMTRTPRIEVVRYFNAIKREIIRYFSFENIEADINNHLAQPVRYFASKTKNPDYFTEIFKFSDDVYSFQSIAETVNMPLPTQDDIIEFKNFIKTKKALYKKLNKKVPQEDKPIVNTGKWFINWDSIKEQIQKDMEDELEYKKNHQITKPKTKKKSNTNAGNMSQFYQFKEMIKNNMRYGNRYFSLMIFYSRAKGHLKGKDEIIDIHFDELLDLANTMGDQFSTEDVDKIKNSITDKPFRNETIFNMIGLKVNYQNHYKENREVKKIEKSNRKQAVLNYIKDNDLSGTSSRKLVEIIKKELDFDIPHKTLSTWIRC